MKVLCVEKYNVHLNRLVHILNRAGYEVLTAASGEQAIAIYAEQAIDGVLLEYDLPDSSGVAVRGEMKRIKPEVPVLLFSGIGPQTPLLLRFFDAYIRQRAWPESALEDS